LATSLCFIIIIIIIIIIIVQSVYHVCEFVTHGVTSDAERAAGKDSAAAACMLEYPGHPCLEDRVTQDACVRKGC
jgi:hypothetical protein